MRMIRNFTGRSRALTLGAALALLGSSLLPGSARAFDVENLIGSWHVLAHYKDAGSDHPDRERWVDHVWKFERAGDRIEWTIYPIVVFDDETGRFERLGTNRQSRILAFWEPNEAQIENIQAGLEVNKRGAKTKTIKPDDEGTWTSATRARPGSMNFISYVENWSVSGLPDEPVFTRSDSLSSGMTETLEGTTRYTATAIDSSGLLLTGRYERDGTQEGTFRMMRSGGTQWVKGSGKTPNQRFREMAVSQYAASADMAPLREQLKAGFAKEGIEVSDAQLEAVSGRIALLAAEGKSEREIQRILEKEMAFEAEEGQFEFAPKGARHDDAHVYRLPFASSKPRPFSLGTFGRSATEPRLAHAVNVRLPVGESVRAARAGEVVMVVDQYERGGTSKALRSQANVVMVLHEDGSYASYLHLSKGIGVGVGDRVEAGQEIAKSGNTGFSAEPHLAFAVWVRDEEGRSKTVPVRFAGKGGEPFAPKTGGYYGGPAAP